jgi:thiol:disulfide interchange protein DsbD
MMNTTRYFINMKKATLALAFALMSFAGMAQIKNPVKWSFSAKKLDATTYELHLTAIMDPSWHIYTIDHKGDIGVPTSIRFKSNPLGTYNGKPKVVGKAVALKDPSTGEMVKFYEKSVDFVQVVKLKAPVKTNIAGTVEFMACDDKQCLPPTEKEFSIALQ